MVWLKIILKKLDALVISHITGHVQVLVLLFPPVSAFRSSHEHVRFFSRHPPFNGHGFRRFPNCTSSCKKLPRMRKKTGDSMEVLTGKTINLGDSMATIAAGWIHQLSRQPRSGPTLADENSSLGAFPEWQMPRCRSRRWQGFQPKHPRSWIV